MDGRNFDALSIWLVTRDSRRTTLQALAASVVAAGLSSFGPQDAAACKGEGKRCKKAKQCCSGACKGKKGKKKCRCSALKDPCTGTFSENTCCGDLACASTACGAGNSCCKRLEEACTSQCDCCGDDSECFDGECCTGEGGACVIIGVSSCCPGLVCELASITCQPAP